MPDPNSLLVRLPVPIKFYLGLLNPFDNSEFVACASSISFSLINSTQAHPSIHENDRSQFFLPTDWCEEGNCFFKLVIELFFVHSVRRRTVETEKLEIFFCVTLSLQSRYLYVCNIFTAQDSDYSTLMSCKRVSFFELHGLKKSSLVFTVNSGITKKQAT